MSDETSEKWHQMHEQWMDALKPGSKIAFEFGGETTTETIREIHYSSGHPAVRAELSRWQRLLLRLTPWRNPVKTIRLPQEPTIRIVTDPD